MQVVVGEDTGHMTAKVLMTKEIPGGITTLCFLQGVFETNKIAKFVLIEKRPNMNGNQALKLTGNTET
jgi:hypothetical protein